MQIRERQRNRGDQLGELTVETLKNRWMETMTCADDSVCRHPGAYKELKCLVNRINHEPVDVAEYYSVAKRLTRLLKNIGGDCPGAVFDYFLPNIDPRKKGSVRHFRFMCQELQCFLTKIDQFRISRRKMKIVR